MLQNSLIQHKWKLVLLKKQALNVNHLAFMDDLILFIHATDYGLQEILNILNKFCQASRQRVKFSKSHLIFNKKVSDQFKQHVCSTLNMPCLGETNTYLGIPFSHTKSQASRFKPLLHKFSLKVESCKKNYITMAGRLIMIKSIIQPLPLHVMSCLKLPYTISFLLEKGVLRFYWGGSQMENKIHWVNWDKLCDRKAEGGLGLRKFDLFNQTMLAKQG